MFVIIFQGATIVAPGGAGGLAHLPLLLMTLRDVTLTGVYTGTPNDLKEFITFFGKHKVK